MKTLFLFAVVLTGLASLAQAQTGDKNTILQIAQGDKLVVKKDLHIWGKAYPLFSLVPLLA
jgi:hypothetical protein